MTQKEIIETLRAEVNWLRYYESQMISQKRNIRGHGTIQFHYHKTGNWRFYGSKRKIIKKYKGSNHITSRLYKGVRRYNIKRYIRKPYSASKKQLMDDNRFIHRNK